MRCEQDLWKFFSWAGWRGSSRDWSGGGYTLDWLQLNLSVSKFLSNVMRYKKRKAFSPPKGCFLVLHCSNGKLNRQLSTFSSIQVSRNGTFHNHKFHWARFFTRWNSDVNDLYTWQLMLCEPKWTFFDVCLPAPLLREALILVQRRAYDTMTSKIFSSRSS